MSRAPMTLCRFLRTTSGAVTFEALIITPLLAWAFVASFVFFDAFRVYGTSVKAAYMVADMLSRQTATVTPADLDGMANIVTHIIRDTEPVRMRVTQIGWVNDAYQIDWSHGVNGAARLFSATLPEIAEDLPMMANGERVLLVETWVAYVPPFDIGLSGLSFDTFTLTRPRYAGQVPFTPPDPG